MRGNYFFRFSISAVKPIGRWLVAGVDSSLAVTHRYAHLAPAHLAAAVAALPDLWRKGGENLGGEKKAA
jgi:hypothetical protein